MSKLAHSNDETMEQIERDARAREDRGERDEPTPPTLRSQIEGLMLAAIDVNAPYAKCMIDEIVKLVSPGADWTPTAENINLLPEPVRRYVMWVQTDADPAGTVRENFIVRQENEGLRKECERLAADARRYRYLRSRDLDTISKGGVFAGLTPKNVVLNGLDLDAWVDDAMGEPSPAIDPDVKALRLERDRLRTLLLEARPYIEANDGPNSVHLLLYIDDMLRHPYEEPAAR